MAELGTARKALPKLSLPSAWRLTIRKKMRLALKMQVKEEEEEVEEEKQLETDVVIKQEPQESNDVQEEYSSNFSLLKKESEAENPPLSIYTNNSKRKPLSKRLTEEQLLPYGCASCDYRSDKKRNLILHIRRQHVLKKTEYACDECNFTALLAKELKLHELQVHRGLTPFTCYTCQYQSPTKHDLRMHIMRHMKIRPHACDECDYRATTGYDLKAHQRKHSKQKPFACDRCDYTCVQSYHLRVHKRKHTGEKPYACTYCEFRTGFSGMLKVHLRKHTGEEKPFACSYCEFRADTSSKLRIHTRSHTGEKPYACPYCEHRSTSSFKMKIHIRRHTGEKPFTCHFCAYRSTNNYKVKCHINNIHWDKFPLIHQVVDEKCVSTPADYQHQLPIEKSATEEQTQLDEEEEIRHLEEEEAAVET